MIMNLQASEKAEPKISTSIDIGDESTILRNDANAIDELSQGIFVEYSKLNELRDEASYEFLLNTVSPSEKKRVLQFHKKDDRKRSLLSILLQRSTIRYA